MDLELPVNATEAPPLDGGEFSEEEAFALRMIILVIGPLSCVLSVFVIATFLNFPEKRKFGAWSLNCMFVVCVAMTDLLLVIGGAAGFDALHDENMDPTPLCYAQGPKEDFFFFCFALSFLSVD